MTDRRAWHHELTQTLRELKEVRALELEMRDNAGHWAMLLRGSIPDVEEALAAVRERREALVARARNAIDIIKAERAARERARAKLDAMVREAAARTEPVIVPPVGRDDGK